MQMYNPPQFCVSKLEWIVLLHASGDGCVCVHASVCQGKALCVSGRQARQDSIWQCQHLSSIRAWAFVRLTHQRWYRCLSDWKRNLWSHHGEALHELCREALPQMCVVLEAYRCLCSPGAETDLQSVLLLRALSALIWLIKACYTNMFLPHATSTVILFVHVKARYVLLCVSVCVCW